MDKLTQLRTEQGEIQTKIDALATALETEKRGFSDVEKTELSTWKARLAAIEEEAKPLQDLQELRGKKVAMIPGPVTGKKESEEERSIQQYSLVKTIAARIQGAGLTGLEREWAQEVSARNTGNGVTGGNYGIPVEVLITKEVRERFDKRDYTATGTTTESLDQGGQLIETDKPGLIEALGNYMILDQLGVRKLTGLQGNLELPKELTKPAATFKAETAAASDQSGLFDTVALSPKRLPGYINYTHQMLVQPGLAMEPYVRRRLAESIAYAVQLNFLIGTGTSNAPTGVLTSTLATGFAGVGGQVVESAGTLDWDSIVDLETLVDTNNALMENLKYVSNSKVRGALKTTAKGASTNDHYLWDSRDVANPVNGYPCLITNQIPNTSTGTAITGGTSSMLAFGNWNHSVLASWGDIFMDTVNANAASGYYQLVVNTFWDVAVLQSKSFAMIADVAITQSYGS